MDSIYEQMCETFPDYPCGKCDIGMSHSECKMMKKCLRYRKFFHDFWERVQSNYLELRLNQRIQGEFMIERLADELEGLEGKQ